MNALWSDIVADYKTGVIDFETMLGKLWATIEAEVSGLPGLIKNIISTDASYIATKYKGDFAQIVTNLQNEAPGITIQTAIPLFIAAAEPVIVAEAKVLAATDWNMISAYFLSNAGISTVQGNAGVVNA